jgi:uncharacterized protein YukE
MKQLKPLFIAAAASAFIIGCASNGYNKADSAASYLETAAERISKGTAQIDAATTALSTLVSGTNVDLKVQLKNYSSAVSGLEATARDVGSRATKIQQLSATYLQQWDDELAKIQNEDIRNTSAERKAAVVKKFDSLKSSYDTARTAFNPLLADLRDIKTALSTDLTPAGIDAISKSMTKVNSEADTVRKALTDLATQFKEVGKSLETPAPPKPQPAEKSKTTSS